MDFVGRFSLVVVCFAVGCTNSAQSVDSARYDIGPVEGGVSDFAFDLKTREDKQQADLKVDLKADLPTDLPFGYCSNSVPCSVGFSCNVIGCTSDHGICYKLPGQCPPTIAPSCGCNGVTYDNTCQRLTAGIALDHLGPCGYSDGGAADAGKDSTSVVKCSIGTCSVGYVCNVIGCATGNTGICQKKPQKCSGYWDPVCGCNGLPYSNDCERISAEVPLKNKGPCVGSDGGDV